MIADNILGRDVCETYCGAVKAAVAAGRRLWDNAMNYYTYPSVRFFNIVGPILSGNSTPRTGNMYADDA